MIPHSGHHQPSASTLTVLLQDDHTRRETETDIARRHTPPQPLHEQTWRHAAGQLVPTQAKRTDTSKHQSYVVTTPRVTNASLQEALR
ncbi:hypothetical protein JANAI62_16500 [Jannaschia pagri]|uniref:Uncharacterized protein n=1 Tax=Jannaschia pagri TaxID=2829797 RepID=A0ABQ4NKU5_9RHOB|nr:MULTISPECIES: hypothetical protein [unclassified Jannaschia]GIT91195.1 hypothetical protein JANAI61_16530 [Jannaschia sp. AI_61]GIT95027.1 hypothetical protein JANAI62_16500 [Jannaschia sp. AI_62]